MKIKNKIELTNIAINLSSDIGYNDFLKIYRECIKEPYSFLTIDTTLPANDPLRFRKTLFFYSDKIKILDRKIKQSEAQYDLDRKAVKISTLPSGNMDKYDI